jgi:hypothetical protein
MGAVNGKPEQTLHRIWRSALLVGFLFHRIFKKTEMDGEFVLRQALLTHRI